MRGCSGIKRDNASEGKKMSLTIETAVIAIAKVQAAYDCTDIEAITKMQGAAAGADDEDSLDVLCHIKAELLGLNR